MASSSDAQCRVSALGNWSKEMHLWGVDFTASAISLSRQAFACCEGDGVKILDRQSKTAMLCGLSARWGRLTWFLQQLKALDAAESITLMGAGLRGVDDELNRNKVRCMLNMLNLFFKDELRDLLNAEKGKILDVRKLKKRMQLGLVASESETMIDASFQHILFQIGAALIWHFDLVVLPFRIPGLARSAPSSKLPKIPLPVVAWDDLIRKNPAKRKMILLDGVTELWNPNRLELLEAAIAFASERQIPLWIFDDSSDVAGVNETAKAPDRSFRGSMNRKLGQLRSRPATQWLSEQSLSRLGELVFLEASKPNPTAIPEIV
ncbi:MAG: hypothetical protein WCL28_03380 [bacterium]